METAKFFEDQGLIKTANISPIWLEATHTKKSDFVRLIEMMTFKHLITAHGEPLINLAHEQVVVTIKRVFP
jgi:hypothetical protein